jgi:hypothetical protein
MIKILEDRGGRGMRTQGLQELVKTIFNDEKTRAQFVSNPESLLRQFSLSENEKAALLKTYSKCGLVSSNSEQFEEEIGPNTWWTSPIP